VLKAKYKKMICSLLLGILCSTGSLYAATIDIMVVYTPKARIFLGSAEACMLKFREEVRKTNKAFEDSGISHRLRLIHLQEVTYVEASSITFVHPDDIDLDRLINPSDGFMDDVHTLRDTHQADCVVLINSKTGGKGIQHGAWALVGVQRLNGYAFSHEVGHLFGAQHAIGDKWSANSPGCQQGSGFYMNSHGYHFCANGTNYHTIMAYPSSGAEVLFPRFSNPDIWYQGTPAGDINTADNASTIELEGPVVAGWRTAYPDEAAPTGISATEGNNYDIDISWNTANPACVHCVYRQQDGTDDVPTPLGIWQTATSFTDSNAVPYTDYRYYVSSKQIGVSSPSPLSAYDIGSCVPGPPANVQATDGTSPDFVAITWDAETTGVYYRVYRSESSTGPIPGISPWQTNTIFHDTPPLGNKPYYYRVQSALVSNGAGATAYSEPDSGYQALVAPQANAANGDETSHVEVRWDAIDNARYYKVWKRVNESSNTPVAVTSWITNQLYLDTDVIPGGKYDYAVSCSPYANDMETSGRGPYNIGWRQYSGPPAGFSASDSTSTNEITTSWDPVDGAPANYWVTWFSTNDTSIREIEPETTNTYLVITNDALISGEEYVFQVRASLDYTFIHATEWSLEDTGAIRLAAPQNLNATDGMYTNRIVLSCDPVEGAGCYQFYRSTSVTGALNAVTIWTTSTVFTNWVAPGQTYYYRVRAAVEPNVRPGDFSAVDPGESGLPPPENLAATDGTGSDDVTVSWDLLTGLYYYRVYCSTELDGAKTALTPWQVGRSTYNHTSAQEGQTYYYWIQAATDASGSHQSAFSDYDVGFRNLPAPTPAATCGAYADRIEISWPEVTGATHYRVYKLEPYPLYLVPLTDWQTERLVIDYTGEPGTSYAYRVKAAASASGLGESVLSDSVIGEKKGHAPVWGRISHGTYDDKITLSWTCDPDIQYFKISRSDSPDGLQWPLQDWTTDRTFDDTTATTGTLYYYQVTGAKSVVGSCPTVPSELGKGWISPATPGKPQASSGEYSDRVEVTWETAAPGLYHRVIRKDPKSDQWVDISGWQTATLFNDTKALPGKTYDYALQAADDETGLHNTPQSDSTQGSRRIAPPSSVNASAGIFANRIQVTWQAVDYAQCYKVYRALKPAGPTNAISGWITRTNFLDKTALQGRIYAYSITAAKTLAGLEESDRSTSYDGWRRPVPPENTEASDGSQVDQVSIQWDDVMPEGYYKVLRAETLDGAKSELTGWIRATQWEDTTAAPGKTYYYFVEATGPNQGTNTSSYATDTGWRGLNLPEAPSLPAPMHLTNNTGRLPALFWKTCDRASSYRVIIWTDDAAYGTVGKDGEPDPVLFGLNTNHCDLEIALEPGVVYYWQVHAQNTAGETAGPVWQFTTLPFTISQITQNDGNITTICWERQPGNVWIDYSTTLKPATGWIRLAGPITGTNAWTGSVPTATNTYFRLRSTP
jgi:fibronectin type 3 domain-containing protein